MIKTQINKLLKGIMFFCLAFCLALTGGCSIVSDMAVDEEVKPWEKDILAQEDMQIPTDPMHIFSDDHIYFSKEASSGGNGVGGGGCGCN